MFWKMLKGLHRMNEKEIKEIKELDEEKKESENDSNDQKDEKKTEQPVSVASQTQDKKSTSGLAIAGFVLGVVGICLSFIPAIGMLAIFIAVIGLVLSAIGISATGKNSAKAGRGLAIAGLVLCLLAGMISTCQCLVCTAALSSTNDSILKTPDIIDELNLLEDKLK